MAVGELVCTRDESIAPDLVNETVYAPGPSRKADPEDRADIQLARTFQHPVGHDAQRIHGLGIEQPITQFDWIRSVRRVRKVAGEFGRKAFFARLGIVVEPSAARPAGPAFRDQAFEDEATRMAIVERGRPGGDRRLLGVQRQRQCDLVENR